MIAEIIKAEIRPSRITGESYLALEVEIDNERSYIYISPKLIFGFAAFCRWCLVDTSKYIYSDMFKGKLFPVKYPARLTEYAGKLVKHYDIDWNYIK